MKGDPLSNIIFYIYIYVYICKKENIICLKKKLDERAVHNKKKQYY